MKVIITGNLYGTDIHPIIGDERIVLIEDEDSYDCEDTYFFDTILKLFENKKVKITIEEEF